MMFTKLGDIKPRILIVDDEPQIGEFLGEYLTEKGYEAFFTDQGEEALEYIKRAKPHILLLDVRMAGMDGIEVLKRAKALDPNIGVIMITALRDEELGRQALQLGAADFITKPVDFEYLDTSLLLKLSSMLE